MKFGAKRNLFLLATHKKRKMEVQAGKYNLLKFGNQPATTDTTRVIGGNLRAIIMKFDPI